MYISFSTVRPSSVSYKLSLVHVTLGEHFSNISTLQDYKSRELKSSTLSSLLLTGIPLTSSIKFLRGVVEEFILKV